MKYHLAKVVGHEVDVCPAVTPKVMRIANQSLLDMARKRDEKEELRNELASRTQSRTMGATSASRVGVGDREMHSFSSSTQPSNPTIPSSTSPYFASRKPFVGTTIKKREKEEANRIVMNCFL